MTDPIACVNGVPTTTTISTIAVQSGNTRIVIALLQSKEWIQLKIQEMLPSMTDIGTNLQEATELHQQHEKVLEKLQTKQSPVEELLRQADDLISTQKPRGEVYSAMAENLGLAWKDLNAQLEQRRHILEQAVAFFSIAQQFSDQLDVIKACVSEVFLPHTIEATQSSLNRLKEERKASLACSMRLLSETQALQERLCEVATHSMGDSRTEHMKPAARQTSADVERHVESLQDRWRHLESLWTRRKVQMEQCLIRCQLDQQMAEFEKWLRTRGHGISSNRNLGDSVANAEILLHESHKDENECKDKQDQILRLVKTAEDLQRQGHFAGEELRNRAYLLLSECSELVSAAEQKRLLLIDSVDFFTKAQTAETKLDQIEIQLSTTEVPISSTTVDDITSPAIQAGRQIVSTTGMTDPGTAGISRKVEELERRRRRLSDLCKAKESVESEKSLAFKKFCEKYDELMNWLSDRGQFFIQRTRDMGTTQTTAKSFLDQHEVLQHDLRMKGMEVDALLRMVPALVRSGGQEAEVVHGKSENLKDQWSQLRMALEKRILISQRYLAFLKLSNRVTKEMDDLESLVKQAIESPVESQARNIEEKQLSLKQEMLQLSNNGKNFLEDARKVDDRHLNMSQPILTVEDIISRLELRNSALNAQWLTMKNEASTAKETLMRWDQLLKDSQKVLKNSQDVADKVFPIIPQDLHKTDPILKFLEKQSTVVFQLKSTQTELENVLLKFESVKPRAGSEAVKIETLQKLQEADQKLRKKITDYEILLSMMVTFFKNYEELEKLIDMQESHFKMESLPKDVSTLEKLLYDHESNKTTVIELFKFSNTEAKQVIDKINEFEPPQAASKDREKINSLVTQRKELFEKSWESHKNKLEHHNQLCIFFRDMHLINQQIQDLNAQLVQIRESFGDSLPSAVHTSEAFLQFEKTIEILQIHIQQFVSTAERMIRDRPGDSVQVRTEMETLQRKWSTFRTEVSANRKLIDVSIEYYKTIEECEEWLKEGSRLLISIARRSSSCTKESEAESLQQEIRHFLDLGKSQQEERMKKITYLSTQLHGGHPHPSHNVAMNKNKDMFNSFSVISSELTTLTNNIKVTQQAKIMEQKGKEEFTAALEAAHAEAEAAKAAAQQALQAAQAAEAAAKVTPMVQPRFIRLLTDAEVPEGTKFTFECQVEGEPTPQVQWFKDSILVENNPDYQTTMDMGICRLTIEETFSEDTATFTCRATNPVGVAETRSHLIVKESRVTSELIPPHFIQEPLDSVVTEKESHQLECQVFGNPLPLVSWFKDDICIDYSTDYSITYNNGFCTMRIEEASLIHKGRYTCRATNQVGQVAASANIEVQTTEPFERPKIVAPLSNVMARAGQKLRLECTLTGKPQPEVSWLHNSKSIKETRDTKFYFDGYTASLVITEAFPKDAGTYTIVAKNKAGEAVSTCNVSVKGRLPLETSDSEIASDIEPAKPQVKEHLVDQTVMEGKKVRMDCVIVGQPEPEVIWYHNGKPVKESDDFQLLFEGDRCTLIIEVAYVEDAGLYKCVAINSGGEASSACQLIVKQVSELIQKSHTTEKDITLIVEKFPPPKFLLLLDNANVIEGQEINLECQVQEEPDVSVTWFKDGMPISEATNCQLKTEMSGVYKLLIPSAKVPDRGTYSVKAQNKGGDAQSICSVFVSPAMPLKSWEMPQELPPSFLQNVSNLNLPLRSTARFEAVVEGIPQPKVRWNFQGKPVPKDDKHEVSTDNAKKHWLVIKGIEDHHIGRYSAIAENNAGIATTSALLSTDDKSISKLERPVNEEYRAQSMIMTRKAVVQKSTISSMSEVNEIDYQPPDFPTFSSLQSQQLVRKEESFTIQKMPDVEPTFSPSSAVEVVTVTPQITIRPPNFSRPVQTAIVTEGEKLLLDAQYEGDPEPSVQWLKDDVNLKSGTKMQITSGSGKTELFILKSSESDSGRYSCIASNTAGKATSIADVKVKSIREAPNFKKKLEAALVKSGTKVNLEVEVTGIPKPEVQWFRNGNPIQDSPDFRISSKNNLHSLMIGEVFPDDSGNYMVTAKNVAGEARSIADLVVEEDKSPDEERKITYQEFMSVQQTNAVFTKVSANESTPPDPYPALSNVETVEDTIPAKTPSPPPMPAVATKVWTQQKPTIFPAPAITETVEPVDMPLPESLDIVCVESEPLLQQGIAQEPASHSTLSSISSHSFVKQSIMKFSQPDIPTVRSETKPVFQAPPLKEVYQNGCDADVKPFAATSQSSSFSLSNTVCTEPLSDFPKLKFAPVNIQSKVPVWQPKKIEDSRTQTMRITEDKPSSIIDTSTSELPCDHSESKFTSMKSVSSTSSQTASEPGVFSSESSTTTRTSYSTEEISITKKYEMVVEHSSENVIDKSIPKPIIKKEISEEPKPKKEVVIVEEPVCGAEVIPPQFSKVRGAESFRKICTDV